MGVSRQEHWSGLPCPPPGDLPSPGIKPASLMSPAVVSNSGVGRGRGEGGEPRGAPKRPPVAPPGQGCFPLAVGRGFPLTRAAEHSYWQATSSIEKSPEHNTESKLQLSREPFTSSFQNCSTIRYGILSREATRNHSEAGVPAEGDPGDSIRSKCVSSLSWATRPREAIRWLSIS